MASILRHDQVAGKTLREDLSDVITDLSPKSTPLVTGLGTSKAQQTIHEWLNDAIPRSTAVNAYAEAADVTLSGVTVPTRALNYVQEITRDYSVSRREVASLQAGMSNPIDFYRAKAMKYWKLDLEYSLLFGSGLSGASGVPWSMKGFKLAVTTNWASYGSGTTITEAILNDSLQLAFNDVDDMSFELYGSIQHKRTISGFTQGATKYVNWDGAADKRMINKTDIYESDVGVVKLFAHRDIGVAAKWILIIHPEAFKVAYLDKPMEMSLPSNGAYTAGYIYGSATLEFRDERGAVSINNIN